MKVFVTVASVLAASLLLPLLQQEAWGWLYAAKRGEWGRSLAVR
jgi:hypothetical protein